MSWLSIGGGFSFANHQSLKLFRDFSTGVLTGRVGTLLNCGSNNGYVKVKPNYAGRRRMPKKSIFSYTKLVLFSCTSIC